MKTIFKKFINIKIDNFYLKKVFIKNICLKICYSYYFQFKKINNKIFINYLLSKINNKYDQLIYIFLRLSKQKEQFLVQKGD